MGFRNISLGMGLDQVKAALKADPCSATGAIRRELPSPDQPVPHRVRRQLVPPPRVLPVCRQQALHHDPGAGHAEARSLLAFQRSFGQVRSTHSLSPQETVWQSAPVRLSLERPLTVKYIDNKTFPAILSKAGAPRDLEKLSREKFIEQF